VRLTADLDKEEGPHFVRMGVVDGGSRRHRFASLHLNAHRVLPATPPVFTAWSFGRITAAIASGSESTPQGGPGQAAAFLLEPPSAACLKERTSCESEPDGTVGMSCSRSNYLHGKAVACVKPTSLR
jgi:hypothetical protein